MANPKEKEGVGFAIKKDIVTKLTEMTQPVSDRIMTMRPPLSQDNFATITSVYAPTMTNPDENKEAFYNQLTSVLSGKCAQWMSTVPEPCQGQKWLSEYDKSTTGKGQLSSTQQN